MAYDIVKLYISLISQAFMLSDVSVMSRSQSSLSSSSSSRNNSTNNNSSNNRNGSNNYIPPPLLPANSHSLCTAYYLQKVLGEVQECVYELGVLDISNEAASGLRSLMESLRWRVVDVHIHEWVRDARMFYHLETWTASSDGGNPNTSYSQASSSSGSSTPTHLLAQFELFQRHMTTAAYNIAANANTDLPPIKTPTSSSSFGRNLSIQAIQQVFVTKVTRGFIDAVYQFLDGLMVLVSDEAPFLHFGNVMESEDEGPRVGVEVGTSLIDLKDPSVRLLLVIANLDHFAKVVIPGMVTQLENAFGVSLADDRNTLSSVVNELDQTLFARYTKPRAGIIEDQIQQAILGEQVDWYRAPQPVGVCQWVSEIMNYLIGVHAQVCNVAPSLLDRALVALIDDLAHEASRCFGQISRFGTGGLLLAVMELTFIHKSLGHYGRETSAGRAIEDIYTKDITQAYSPSSRDSDFQSSFDAMQRTLADARRSTGVQFLCFRKVKTKDGGEKDGSVKEKSKARNRNKE